MIDEPFVHERFQQTFGVEPPPGSYERLRSTFLASKAIRRRPRFLIAAPSVSGRLVAIVMVFVLAVAAAAAFFVVRQYTHMVVPVRHVPSGATRLCGLGTGVDMIDDKNGWNGTQRTTDGGSSWHDVSPPPVSGAIKGGGSPCTLDALHAWEVQAVGPGAYQPTAFVVSATSDGGQSWRSGEPIPVAESLSWRGNYDALLTFIDDAHGWFLFDTGTASTPNYARTIFESIDGGVTWKQITNTAQSTTDALARLDLGCDETRLTFTTTNDGWLSFMCGQGHIPANPPAQAAIGPPLLVTTDGGRTWSAAHVPFESTACDPGAPIFSGPDGVIPIQGCGVTSYYRTADGGLTWAPVKLPADSDVTVDFVNGLVGYAFHVVNPRSAPSNELYRTDDGGATWRLAAKDLFVGQSIGSFQFIDSETGYANAPPGMWWTNDGGVTWNPPAGFRSVGTQICQLPPGPPTSPFEQDQPSLRMVTPSVGWASGAWRTMDGGAHWTNVAPRSVAERQNGYGEFFLDPDHAWVAESAGSAKACVDRVVVLATSDGGSSWERVSTITAQLPSFGPSNAGDWGLSLSFVDANNGWLFVQAGLGCSLSCSAATPGVLYHTLDGGHQWTIVSSAVEDATGCAGQAPLSFDSLTSGWMYVRCANGGPSLQFLATFDSGKTWAVQVLDPQYCCAKPPIFVDPEHGWLLENSGLKLLVTADEGHSWQTGSLPHINYYVCYFGAAAGRHGGGVVTAPPPGPQQCADQSAAAVAYINVSDGWAVMIKSTNANAAYWYVARTTDGGRTWAAISSPTLLQRTFQIGEYFAFVDPNNGFWWFGGNDMLVTHDGGRSWMHIQMSAA